MGSVRRIVVGLSGASGSVYGIRALEILKDVEEIETHLVMTAAARRTLEIETDYTPSAVEKITVISGP